MNRPRIDTRLGLAILCACAVGLALRLWNLRPQVLGGDELHAVRLAMSAPLDKILWRHTDFDHGRPLTAAYRLAMDAGVVFDELTFRAPILLAGLLLLALWPLATARFFGRGAAAVHAGLLALSPVLVLYSRIVRTYVPVSVLAGVAVLAFYAWSRDGRARFAVLYGVAAVLAVSTHLLSAPFVLAPFVFALGERLFLRRGPTLRRWALLAALTLLVLALAHLPLWEGMLRLARTRASESRPTLHTLLATLAMQAGSARPAFVALFTVLALAGLLRAWRIAAHPTAYLASVWTLHLVGLALIGPKQADQALVLDRYLLVGTPLVLGCVAVCLGVPWSARRGLRVAQVGLVTAFLCGAFLLGPLAEPSFRRGSFVHHNRLVAFAEPREDPSLTTPPSYGLLEGEGAVLEFPWNPQWNQSLAPLFYQRSHGREVVVAGRQVTAEHPRVRLRNAVPIDGDPLEAFLASRARWLVVHQDPSAEEPRQREGQASREAAQGLRRDAATIGRAMAGRFGPPVQADERVAIWDLDACRARARESASRGAQRSGQNGR